MTDALSGFLQKDKPSETFTSNTALQYNYIWQNLDQLFVQIGDQADINELNQKYLSLAFEKLAKKNTP